MPEILEYLDYRDFLKDFYENKKASHSFFSIRYMALKLGLDSSNLVKIMQGQRHLKKNYFHALYQMISWDEKQIEYFELLVQFNRSKKDRDTKTYFEKLLKLKDYPVSTIEKSKYEVFQKWYYLAIRALLDTKSFKGNLTQIVDSLDPSIGKKEVKHALKILEDLKLIEKDNQGFIKPTAQLLTTGPKWKSIAIKKYQEECIKLAERSLNTHAVTERDISTVTLSLNRKDLELVKEATKQYRKQIMDIAEKSKNSNQVYQLNVQCFPLSK